MSEEDDFDNIPEDDVDDVFRDVLNLVMKKIEMGTNPMALAGVMNHNMYNNL